MEKEKVGWNEISLTLKIATIGGMLGLLSFTIGFIIGFAGAY